MFKYFTLDSFDFTNKIVALRIDINSPVIDKKVVMNERISAATKSIKELIAKKAKIVLLAHQGRKGKDDFVSLKEHSKFLEKELGTKINFVPEVYSKKVISEISKLKSSEILLLENLRFEDHELNYKVKENKIAKLQNHIDYYVFDAFSVSHRKQSSVVSFRDVPFIAGRLMEKELKGLHKIEETPSPHMYLFGGAKPDDLLYLLENSFKQEKVDHALFTGIIGELALHSKGYYLGKKISFLKEQGYLEQLPRIKKLLEKYSDLISLPRDVAIKTSKGREEIEIDKLEKEKGLLDKYEIQDIGSKTIREYKTILSHAGSLYFKGPAGNFEIKEFQKGTKELLEYISSLSAFSFMGGGHSVTAASMFSSLNSFSYVSLAGGALVSFLSGETLPGLNSLQESFHKFECLNQDFVVVGSNTMDISVSIPEDFSDVNLGDKIRIDENFKTSIGGGGFNVSVCLSRLGASPGYLGKVAYENQEMFVEELKKNKITYIESSLSRRPAAKSILLDFKDKDRIILTYRGQNSYLGQKDFNISKLETPHYYFTSLTGESFKTQLSYARELKKKKNITICYNPSSYLIGEEKEIFKLIKEVDILVLNLEEAQELTNKQTVSQCFTSIHSLGPKIVVITDGAHGAYASDSKKEYFQNSVKTQVVDSTGAGDAFSGTFYYFISKGASIKTALRYASKNAASVVSKKGSTDGLLHHEDLVL